MWKIPTVDFDIGLFERVTITIKSHTLENEASAKSANFLGFINQISTNPHCLHGGILYFSSIPYLAFLSMYILSNPLIYYNIYIRQD